jgi:DnaJ-class molecular chaperone
VSHCRLSLVKSSYSIQCQRHPLQMSYYSLLSLPSTATQTQIRKAYLQAARKHHPDKSNPSILSVQSSAFHDLTHAFQTLSNPRSRALYDAQIYIHVHENIEWNEQEYECRCGTIMQVEKEEEQVVQCRGCSLNVRIVAPREDKTIEDKGT